LLINRSGTISEYLEILQKLYTQKKAGLLLKRREVTAQEIRNTYSKKLVIKELQTKLFGVGK
jgi:hypothetical protein